MASTTLKCYLCDKPASMEPDDLVCARCWKVHRLTSDALEHRVPSMHPEKADEVFLIDDDLEKTDPKPFDPWWLRTLP